MAMVHLAMVRLGFHLSVLADTFLRGDPVIEEGRNFGHIFGRGRWQEEFLGLRCSFPNLRGSIELPAIMML